MAILFYDSIDLSAQEIQDVSLENLNSDPSAYQGRIYFNTVSETLVYYSGATLGWISLDGTGNVDSVTASGGLTTSGSSTAAAVIIIPDYTSATNIILSAGTSGSLADTSNLLVANGNTVKYYPVSDLPSLLLSGVVSVDTSDTTFISMTPTTATGGAVTLTASLRATGTAGAGKYLEGSGNGAWVTPASNTNTTYTLPASGGSSAVISLTDNTPTVISTVNFTSTAGEVTATESAGTTITFSLPSAVVAPGTLSTVGLATIGGDLTVATTATVTGTLSVTGVAAFTAIPTMPSSTTGLSTTDAASKAYVDALVAGGLLYKGGYDATTSAPVGSGVLQGYTYAVTTGGTDGGYWNPALEEGDLIICEKINNPLVQADWTILENNVVLATNTTAGIAKFLTGNGFAGSMTAGSPALEAATSYGTEGSATTTPTIVTDAFGKVTTISSQSIQIPSTQVTDFTSAVNTQLNLNTQASLIGNGALLVIDVPYTIPAGLDVSVQLYQAASPYATVYARVEREIVTAGSAWKLVITFSTIPASNSIKCLIVGSKV